MAGQECADLGIDSLRSLSWHDGAAIPTTVWRPASGASVRTLVLIGHGGSGHREDRSTTELVREICRRPACAAMAIDGPVHGERRERPGEPHEVLRDWRSYWRRDPQVLTMVEHWRLSLDGVLASMPDAAIGYYGLSMGSLYGTALMAADSRISAGVLGMWGGKNNTRAALIAAARAVRVPVVHYLRWNDERFERSTVVDIFDEYPTPDKILIAEPGLHVPPAPAMTARLVDFLVAQCHAGGQNDCSDT